MEQSQGSWNKTHYQGKRNRVSVSEIEFAIMFPENCLQIGKIYGVLSRYKERSLHLTRYICISEECLKAWKVKATESSDIDQGKRNIVSVFLKSNLNKGTESVFWYKV